MKKLKVKDSPLEIGKRNSIRVENTKLTQNILEDLYCIKHYVECGRKEYGNEFYTAEIILNALIDEFQGFFNIEKVERKNRYFIKSAEDIESFVIAMMILPKHGIVSKIEKLCKQFYHTEKRDRTEQFLNYCVKFVESFV